MHVTAMSQSLLHRALAAPLDVRIRFPRRPVRVDRMFHLHHQLTDLRVPDLQGFIQLLRRVALRVVVLQVVQPGQVLVVPAGVRHRPRAEEGPVSMLVIDPMGVKHTGDEICDRTVEDYPDI